MQLGRLAAAAPLHGISNGECYRFLTIFFFAEETIFIGSFFIGSAGLNSIYAIEFRRYKNSRPLEGGNFCLLAPFLLINQRFALPYHR